MGTFIWFPVEPTPAILLLGAFLVGWFAGGPEKIKGQPMPKQWLSWNALGHRLAMATFVAGSYLAFTFFAFFLYVLLVA